MNIKKLLLIIFAISLFINISLFSWPSNSSKSNSKEQDIIDSSSGFTKRKGGKKIIREKVISTGSKRIFNEQNEKNEVSESNVLDSEILKVVTLNEN
ncbi:MAG: hypothetical protein OEV44_11780, partial [Spirochaetota bacterium]|nr:hypothetical protein [Spirochaetota bacterium]